LQEGELFNSSIIPKNPPYPVEENRSDYVTTYDNQETLDIYVLEGEAEDPRDCELVGSYQIYNIPKRSAGQTRLKVTYGYNENQIVEVKAINLKDDKTLPLRTIENADLDQMATSRGMDIALLIDCSGRMSGTPLKDAKNAAISFLNNFRVPNGRVGLITFPGGIVHPLHHDFHSVKNKMKRLDAYNSTPMTEALDLAHNQMLVSGEWDGVIVILSDGAPDNSSSAESSARIAKNKGIKIITIGVSGADEEFLRKIASSPGDYYFCNQSFEMESTFINIATQLTSGEGLSKL